MPPDARRRAWFAAGHGALAGGAMQPPGTPPYMSAPLDLARTATIRYPFGLSGRSTMNSWTRRADAASASPPGRVVHHANQQSPRVSPVSSRVNHNQSHVHLAIEPLQFSTINPQSILVQNKYKSALFFFG